MKNKDIRLDIDQGWKDSTNSAVPSPAGTDYITPNAFSPNENLGRNSLESSYANTTGVAQYYSSRYHDRSRSDGNVRHITRLNSLGAYERSKKLSIGEFLRGLALLFLKPRRLAIILAATATIYVLLRYIRAPDPTLFTSEQLALTTGWYEARDGRPPLVSISRVYADVNNKKPRDLWDWENYSPELSSDIDRYVFGSELGSGKYSFVYRATDIKANNETVAVKVFTQERPTKMRRELLILQQLKGKPHILKYKERIMDHLGVCAIVMEYIEQPPWKILYKTFGLREIKLYGKQLLLALAQAHEMGIMHRDVKPLNLLINNKTSEAILIDWGLAEFYHPGKSYPLRVATKMFKPPELLLGMSQYDYSLDMWMVGVHLAGQLFQVNYLFNGESDEEQLELYIGKFGSQPFVDYADKYQLSQFPEYKESRLSHYRENPAPTTPWSYFSTAKNKHLLDSWALDLLDKLLVVDHAKRLTANEALAHPFFNGV